MRKYKAVMCMLIALALLSACSKSNVVKEVVQSNKENQATEMKVADFRELLAEGKIDGEEFRIGMNSKEIINLLGKPKDKGIFNGMTYYSYDGRVIFFDSITDEGNISIISYIATDKSFYGVRVGMKPTEIIQILGTPEREEFATHEDELLDGQWYFQYNAGKNSVMFTSKNKDSPTDFAYIFKRNI